MNKTVSNKIVFLNKIVLRSMAEGDIESIIKNFTDDSIKMFGADFGFIRGKFRSENKSSMVYQSADMPCEAVLPRRKNSGHALFDTDVRRSNYEGEICRHLKSYLIIPIRYVDHVYGNLVLCYKNKHDFTKEELALSDTIGGALAQAVTINWLVEKGQKDIILGEKQKEIEVLLNQEKLKTEFIGNATHELRTPLAIMKGNIDLALLSKDDLKVYKETLNDVGLEINILADILTDLTLLTSAGKNIKEIIETSEVDLYDLLGQIVKRLGSVAKKKNISIDFTGDKKSEVLVPGDKNYLEKLFLNIAKNAITYGKEGGFVKISLSKEKKFAKIDIEDNGIGISKEDSPKIFDRFYRADKAHTGGSNHSGLGLAIAKWVSDIHNGEIKVDSVPGKGSTFTVLLPLARG